MIRWMKVFYLVSVACWTGYQVSHPNWQGLSYMEDFQKPGVYLQSGSFGLQEDSQGGWKHPIWNPPKAYSDAIHATVRWPWQEVQSQYHVELNLAHVFESISLGFIVMGAALWLGHWLSARRVPDLLVCIAWAVAVGFFLAWLVLLGLAFFTMGFGVTETVTNTLLLAGLVSGLLYGAITFTLTQPRTVIHDASARRPPTGIELFWFTLGSVLACAATYAAAWIAENFRGGVAGVTELGTTRFVNDQTMVNAVTGCSLIAIGWLLGLVMWRGKLPVALIIGWLIAITILGGVFAFWK